MLEQHFSLPIPDLPLLHIIRMPRMSFSNRMQKVQHSPELLPNPLLAFNMFPLQPLQQDGPKPLHPAMPPLHTAPLFSMFHFDNLSQMLGSVFYCRWRHL